MKLRRIGRPGAEQAISNDVSEREFHDKIPDSGKLGLRTWVNGQLRQHGSTENLILDVPGHPYLRPGNHVELEINGLGVQTQTLAEA